MKLELDHDVVVLSCKLGQDKPTMTLQCCVWCPVQASQSEEQLPFYSNDILVVPLYCFLIEEYAKIFNLSNPMNNLDVGHFNKTFLTYQKINLDVGH
jgi:hypothetical protein